jgi:adenosine deaminase
MSTASFIEALPKVDLNVQLIGAIQPKTLLMIADQNEIAETLKRFGDWVRLVQEPDRARLYEIARMACSWLKAPDDLTRVVYDVGTTLAKQNVKYAEVAIDPTYFPDLNLSFDGVLTAINDGRDRAKRAWGIDMAWVFTIPREEPRRADDLARWAGTAGVQRGGVVGLGLSGDEKAQPVGQFERAFQMALKKDLPRVARAGDMQGAEGVLKTVAELQPNRILDGWGAAESADAVTALVENNITLAVNLTRAVKQGWVESAAEYPLRKLYDDGVSLALCSDMPGFYQTTLNAEYAQAVEQGGLTTAELEDVALNAVRASFLGDTAKAEMLQSFTEAYGALRAEHLEAVGE